MAPAHTAMSTENLKGLRQDLDCGAPRTMAKDTPALGLGAPCPPIMHQLHLEFLFLSSPKPNTSRASLGQQTWTLGGEVMVHRGTRTCKKAAFIDLPIQSCVKGQRLIYKRGHGRVHYMNV